MGCTHILHRKMDGHPESLPHSLKTHTHTHTHTYNMHRHKKILHHLLIVLWIIYIVGWKKFVNPEANDINKC